MNLTSCRTHHWMSSSGNCTRQLSWLIFSNSPVFKPGTPVGLAADLTVRNAASCPAIVISRTLENVPHGGEIHMRHGGSAASPASEVGAGFGDARVATEDVGHEWHQGSLCSVVGEATCSPSHGSGVRCLSCVFLRRKGRDDDIGVTLFFLAAVAPGLSGLAVLLGPHVASVHSA